MITNSHRCSPSLGSCRSYQYSLKEITALWHYHINYSKLFKKIAGNFFNDKIFYF